jgi:outer membrane protein assembly factor BamB
VGANVEINLRNDPLTANKDAVQYVFWGRESFLNIPCRGNSPLYDDNRHDADGEEPKEEWRFGTGGPVSVWYPAIGRDGTIYMSDQNATLYALNEDGSVKWTFNLTDGNEYMPGIDLTGGPNDGTIYSDIFGNSLVAINPDGTEKWRSVVGGDIDSTPTVGPDGVIYFGTDSADLVAFNPDGTEKWRFATGGEVDNVAALSPDASVVYFVSNDANLYALNTVDGTERWRFPIAIELNEIQSSPIVKQSDGTIYVGSDDQYVYALKEVARLADPTGVGGVNAAQGEWRFRTNGEIESSAAIDPVDGTIYIGSDDGNVWAINPNGTEKWRFPTGGNVESSAIIDLDRTIYIGSLDGNIYAINPDGTQKWFFPTGAAVPSSPILGQEGFIHIGSNDSNLYTISQFGDPRNFKDEDKSAGKLLTVEDLDSSVVVDSNTDWLNGAGSKGSFAVRLEVDRALVPNVDGAFDYELRLWIRQCPDQNDFPCSDILGTFFQDTRIAYDYTAVTELPMRQRFSLSGTEHDAFERFFFGFTGAAGAEALDVTISQFQLSFIRPGDPVVDCDRNSWPLEDSPPLPDCVPLL